VFCAWLCVECAVALDFQDAQVSLLGFAFQVKRFAQLLQARSRFVDAPLFFRLDLREDFVALDFEGGGTSASSACFKSLLSFASAAA